MKLLLNDTGDSTYGSTRIWIYNLFHWFSELGYNVTLNDWQNYSNYHVVIFGKNTGFEEVQKAKNTNPDLICGIINPSDHSPEKRKILDTCNFYIVGSIEERDYYLRYNQNVFIFPLIERMFDKIKKHEDHKPIILGYHGNLSHLWQFEPYLKKALEILGQNIPLELIVVYNKKALGRWERGRPQNIEIKEVQWELHTIQDILLQCDIGLLPGLTSIGLREKKHILKFFNFFNKHHGGYSHDYLIRFKNTTNSGRAFVFHQLGIPVVSDFLPSSFHILGDLQCGYLAHYADGWVHAIKDLAQSAEKRTEIAQNALKEFNRLYNPLEWSRQLHRSIENMLVKNVK